MILLQETDIDCPYCGENNTLVVDDSAGDQQYIEDCQVCCRPIHVHLTVLSEGGCSVDVHDENEA